MEKNIYLITNDYRIVMMSNDSYNTLDKIGDKALVIPEETYIAITLSETRARNIVSKLKKEKEVIKKQKESIKTNLLKSNLLSGNCFSVWVKPKKVNFDYPDELLGATGGVKNDFFYYKEIKDCKITLGFKEGSYGIATNGVTFDHIKIKDFNCRKKCIVEGEIYQILLFNPYE